MNRKDFATARSFKHLVQRRFHPLDIRVFDSRARGEAVCGIRRAVIAGRQLSLVFPEYRPANYLGITVKEQEYGI
ncbi:MAG: hypothetical protein PHY09_15945 [Desulfuromonadaceae bacterium]|nr:hypothetical protein [Desulfuromonadaceae bacterium]MDD5105644.1 hypothetical protein [Desulfuromonadaceae bacterium]